VDTLHGVTYLAISPESELLEEILSNEDKLKLKEYQE
jgi:leucyl-tRNA synthetase